MWVLFSLPTFWETYLSIQGTPRRGHPPETPGHSCTHARTHARMHACGCHLANKTTFSHRGPAVLAPPPPIGLLWGEVRIFFHTWIQIFISLFIPPFYKIYIHTIWFDKIHFVTRTKIQGIPVTGGCELGQKPLRRVFLPTIAGEGGGVWFLFTGAPPENVCGSRHTLYA